jgi:hypothetical protein
MDVKSYSRSAAGEVAGMSKAARSESAFPAMGEHDAEGDHGREQGGGP